MALTEEEQKLIVTALKKKVPKPNNRILLLVIVCIRIVVQLGNIFLGDPYQKRTLLII